MNLLEYWKELIGVLGVIAGYFVGFKKLIIDEINLKYKSIQKKIKKLEAKIDKLESENKK